MKKENNPDKGLHSIGKEPLPQAGGKPTLEGNSGVDYPDENYRHVEDMVDGMDEKEQKYAHVHLNKKMEPKKMKAAPGENIEDFANKMGEQD
jgi:hypothetical protein